LTNIEWEPLLEMFIFETTQMLEQLEQNILKGEEAKIFDASDINEIFRIMHTIKSSAAMMQCLPISKVAHSVEDLFSCLREDKPQNIEYSILTDLILDVLDFMKAGIEKVSARVELNDDPTRLIQKINDRLYAIKNENGDGNKEFILCNNYRATIFFEDDCGMEHLRAFTLVHNLKEHTESMDEIIPSNLDEDKSQEIIKQEGLKIRFRSLKTNEQMHEILSNNPFIRDLLFEQILEEQETLNTAKGESYQSKEGGAEEENTNKTVHQNLISVNVTKLDMLMDIVGELVISEAMVLQNPDLTGLKIDNFQKSSIQLQKITNELRDIVMSIRMLPLSTTFRKMQRLVRDMSKKLDKEVRLITSGEETEVDKNIIENISDPLMHLVRNSLDHGIESSEEREATNKPKIGTISLEAKHVGSDVLIIIKDDGGGLDKKKILAKAKANGLLHKAENEMSDKEIYNLIFLPGFSTKESVTEFSGRGVGMDVVMRSIGNIGGTVSVDSKEGAGSTITMKIPLTLAIIDGMIIQVGKGWYTLPITAIRESFRPNEHDIIKDSENHEMIIVRGQCYPIIRLHELYKIHTKITDFKNGILVMVEQGEKSICLFADALLGQQQVVVKSLPNYIRNVKKIVGVTGCTLLGDGNISLILDIGSLIDFRNINLIKNYKSNL